MNTVNALLLIALLSLFAQCEEAENNSLYPTSAVRMSQDFILAIKTNQDYNAYLDTIANINLQKLSDELQSSNQKLAFWINTYNALVQTKIRGDVKAFDDKDQFFKDKDQEIGGEQLSLDQIENGILRRQKQDEKQEFIDRFKVDQLDPRIHFTLNCGASSCPPVAYYSVENLDTELGLAEESYVTQTSTYNEIDNVVEVSELFKWFEADFGGKDEVITLLMRLEVIPTDSNPDISYAPYNWNLDIENY